MWLEIRTECWVSCWINGNICRKIRYTYWFSLVSELISCSLVSSGLFSWLIPLPSSILNPSDADCSASRWSCPCVSPSSVLAGLANLHHGPSKSKVSSSVMTFSGATCPHGYLRHEPSFSFPPGLSRACWNAQTYGLLCRQIWVPTRLTWRYSPFPHPWDSVGGKWYKERGKMPEKIPQLPAFFFCFPPTLLFPHGAGTTPSSGVVLWRHEEDIDVLALSTNPVSHHSG